MGEHVSVADAEAAGRVVSELGAPEEVGAAVMEVLVRQAEGRSLLAGEEFVRSVLERHGLSADRGATALGNVFEILTTGATSSSERGLVVAFAASAAARLLRKDAPASERELVRFVRAADWFETSTDYAVYAYLGALLTAEERRSLAGVLEATILEDARQELDAGSRGRVAVRLAALHALEGAAPREAFERITNHARDAVVRQTAAGLLGRGARLTQDSELRGVWVSFPARGLALRLLRWLSGWALVVGALRGLGWLLGVRREVQVALVESRLSVAWTTRMLGRTISESETVIPLYAVTRLERQVRYPALVLAVGAASLALGVVVGGTLLADGVRSGESFVLLVGAGLLLGGVVLDAVLEAAFHGAHGRVLVELTGHGGLKVRMRAEERAATQFLRDARAALSRTRAARSA